MLSAYNCCATSSCRSSPVRSVSLSFQAWLERSFNFGLLLCNLSPTSLRLRQDIHGAKKERQQTPPLLTLFRVFFLLFLFLTWLVSIVSMLSMRAWCAFGHVSVGPDSMLIAYELTYRFSALRSHDPFPCPARRTLAG